MQQTTNTQALLDNTTGYYYNSPDTRIYALAVTSGGLAPWERASQGPQLAQREKGGSSQRSPSGRPQRQRCSSSRMLRRVACSRACRGICSGTSSGTWRRAEPCAVSLAPRPVAGAEARRGGERGVPDARLRIGGAAAALWAAGFALSPQGLWCPHSSSAAMLRAWPWRPPGARAQRHSCERARGPAESNRTATWAGVHLSNPVKRRK